MEKRDLTQLAVYKIYDDAEMLPLRLLKPLYVKRTSEIVYVIKKEIVFGIVCLGDVLRSHQGWVAINTDFLKLTGLDTIRAREIFREKKNINKIPVINEQGKLLADYSRWDDNLFIERNKSWFLDQELVAKALMPYKKTYLVEPNDSMNSSYLYFKHCLDQFKIYYMCISKEDMKNEYEEEAVFIFLNEDERRGTQCLLLADLGREEFIDLNIYGKWITFKSFLMQMFKKRDLKVVEELGNYGLPLNSRIDEKASVLFSELRKRGVQCLAVYADGGGGKTNWLYKTF